MSPIYSITLSLVLSLYILRVSPQFHVAFSPSFATINGRGVNLVPPSYLQAMCRFIKVNKSVSMHYEKHDPSTTFISPSCQGCATSENSPEPEEDS